MLQKITFIFSIIGACGTIYSIFHNIYENRIKINSYIKYINFGKNYLVGYIVIENNSKTSISVTNIELKIGNTNYYFINVPHWVLHTQYKNSNKVEDSYVYSLEIPFTLSSYGATGGYFLANLQNTVPNLDTTGFLKIGTNRNKTFEFSIQLGDIPHQEHSPSL